MTPDALAAGLTSAASCHGSRSGPLATGDDPMIGAASARDRRQSRSRHAAAAAVLLSTAILSGCSSLDVACPAILYMDSNPIEVRLGGALLDQEVAVAACFGEGCRVADIDPDDNGRWSVPQRPPYDSSDDRFVGAGEYIRVVVTDPSGMVARDITVPIPYISETDGPCPGPFTFEPVVIE